MSGATGGGKSVIKSIRIDSDLERGLALVSKKRKVTESAYLSEALRKQLLVEPLSPAFDNLTVERTMFRAIVELSDIEAIEFLGGEVARREIVLALDLLNLPLQTDSLWILLSEVVADCWHWFKVGLNARTETRILLYHDYGMNWSIFLRAFLMEAFALVSQNPPRIIATERLVKVDLAERGHNKAEAGGVKETRRDTLVISRS